MLGGPQYLTFGPDLVVTDINGHMFRYDPVTGVSTSERALDNPVGVAFDASGNLYVGQRISIQRTEASCREVGQVRSS